MEIAVNRMKPVTVLAHWLAILSPRPQPTSQGPSGGAPALTAHDNVYILEPLPKIDALEAHVASKAMTP